MPLGFLKSAREPKRPLPDAQTPVAEPRPDGAAVLGEVEELGIGMFWATDAEGHLSFLSQRAMVDLGTDSQAMIGKPLPQFPGPVSKRLQQAYWAMHDEAAYRDPVDYTAGT